MSEPCQCGDLKCEACYSNQSPKYVDNVLKYWDKKFQENFTKFRDHERAKRRLEAAIREVTDTRRRMEEL